LLESIIDCYEKNLSSLKLTSLEKKVYREILKVPLGHTFSYKDIARKIKKPRASRAVGRALKKNPFFLLLPCHRVVGSYNKLGGYNLGKSLKRRLLKLERKLLEILEE